MPILLTGVGDPGFHPGKTANAIGFWDQMLSRIAQAPDGVTASGNGDVVGYFQGLPATLSAGNMTQATGANKPHLDTTNGIAWGSPTYLQPAVPISLTGAFAVYAVGSRASGSIWTLLGGTTAGANPPILTVYSDNNAYCITDAAGVASGAVTVTGSVLIRFRRDASNRVMVAASGQSELLLGTLAGTLTLGAMAARPGNTEYSGNYTRSLLAVAADTVAAGTDARIRSWYTSKYGLTIP